jgi:Photosynthetic reaction centre cytochrome C subunit
MMHKNIIKALLGLTAFIWTGVAAVQASYKKERNLKVLPIDISDQKLDSIMQTYNLALGVQCEFCHVKQKVFPGEIDYASDAEPMKEEARKMMRMVIDINKNNFWFNKTDRPEYLHTVSCKTCHRGEPYPKD